MANYPQIVTQEWLDRQRTEESLRDVRLELTGCFNYRPVPIAGKRGKRYQFKYDAKASCHALIVPEKLWMENGGAMARDLMLGGSTGHYRIIVLVVPCKVAATKAETPLPAPKKKPSRKSAEAAALAVLGG